MFQVRIHGRGGQGVVTATELLSMAAFEEGRHAQAFPSFGSERTGAPVAAFCRIADGPIRVQEPVVVPDAVVVQDATLLHQVDVFQGLGPSAYVLINSLQTFEDLGLDDTVASQLPERLATVPATYACVSPPRYGSHDPARGTRSLEAEVPTARSCRRPPRGT